MVVWLILYFADALLITDSRSSHCFLVNSQNCGKKGRKKGTRERTSGVLTICVQKRNTPLFFFRREESAACRAAYHLSLCFCFSSDPPRGRAEDEGGVRLTHNRYHILLQLLSLFLLPSSFSSISEKDGKKERKNEKTEIKTKAKPKMTSKMDDF